MIKLDLVQTVAFSGLVLFAGHAIRRLIPPLARYNVPAPVVGGLLAALAILAARRLEWNAVAFDTTLQSPLMIAFFTTIGFGASLALLRTGGPQVLLFFAIATVFAVVQNVVGIAVALGFGLHPLFGVLGGSVTLTGGPATGLAFAPLFEAAGVPAAATVAVAVAMGGIVSGGLVGGPAATSLIERHRLRRARVPPDDIHVPPAQEIVERQLPEPPVSAPAGEDREAYVLLKTLVVILAAMWLGGGVSRWFASLSWTLPAYIGAMLVAAAIRNLDDYTGWIGLSQRTVDDVGNVALSLFLAMAIMTLELWRLAGLAMPLLVVLAVQVLVTVAVCFWPVFALMGRDYESAVMSGGFIGFMLGTTANAMANMEALVERYGPAPRAFLVVPMVGAFFIDFTNALLITGLLNLLA